MKKTISPGFPLYLNLFLVTIFPSFISKLFPQIFNVGNLYLVIVSFCLLFAAKIFLSYYWTSCYSSSSDSDINADLLSLNSFSWIFWRGGIFSEIISHTKRTKFLLWFLLLYSYEYVVMERYTFLTVSSLRNSIMALLLYLSDSNLSS